MAILRFNKAIINGVTVTTADFCNGTGAVNYDAYDKSVTTIDHVIHNVRISLNATIVFWVWGDKRSLETQAIAADSDNFGGTHSVYYDNTKIFETKGLVTTKYLASDDQTEIRIEGESNGIS